MAVTVDALEKQAQPVERARGNVFTSQITPPQTVSADASVSLRPKPG